MNTVYSVTVAFIIHLGTIILHNVFVGTVAQLFSQCSYVPDEMECCTSSLEQGNAISEAEMLIGVYTFSECMAKCKVGGTRKANSLTNKQKDLTLFSFIQTIPYVNAITMSINAALDNEHEGEGDCFCERNAHNVDKLSQGNATCILPLEGRKFLFTF